MFDRHDSGIGLWPGESIEDVEAGQSADLSYRLTCLALADGWVEADRDLLPDTLEDIPVGPFLAAVVSSVDRSRLNGHDAVRLMQTEARLASCHEAQKLASMAEVACSPAGDADSAVERSFDEIEYVAVEIAAALTLTRRAAESQLNQAVSLTGRLARVWDSFSQGLIDLAKARVFDQQLGHLPEATVDTILDRTLDAAPGLTTGQLRARISREVMEADPDGAASGFHEGLRDRKLTFYPNPDFTASLGLRSVDPSDLAAVLANIDRIARLLKVEGEGRTLDQIRADVAVDLLKGHCLCGESPNPGGGVHLNVDLATLVGSSHVPGELAGYGPVLAEVARKTALRQVDGEWTYQVTDNGKVIATGTTSRRPSAAQKRRLRARYQTCVFVGCRRPAYHCDLDHRRPHSQGGPTHNDNLGPLCRHHHMAKHHVPWQLERLPNGDHQWTSPLGHTYIRKRAPPD